MRLKVILTSLAIIVLWLAYPKTKCKNPFQVQDFTKKQGTPVKICDHSVYYGSIKIADKSNFLEVVKLKDKGLNNFAKQYIRLFERKENTYISIISMIDYAASSYGAIHIYKLQNNRPKPVFIKPFNENKGRYQNIQHLAVGFYNQQDLIKIAGDLGYLGCYSCRIYWNDYYRWNKKKEAYILANNQHKKEFGELLIKYKKQDENACLQTSGTSGVISELYPIRKNSERFCNDQAGIPFITNNQAKTLLQAIKAAELIIQGNNIAGKNVKNIKID